MESDSDLLSDSGSDDKLGESSSADTTGTSCPEPELVGEAFLRLSDLGLSMSSWRAEKPENTQGNHIGVFPLVGINPSELSNCFVLSLICVPSL